MTRSPVHTFDCASVVEGHRIGHALRWGSESSSEGGTLAATAAQAHSPSVSTAVAVFAASEMKRLQAELAAARRDNGALRASLESLEATERSASAAHGSPSPLLRSRATSHTGGVSTSPNRGPGAGGDEQRQLFACLATIDSLRASAEAADVLHQKEQTRFEALRLEFHEAQRTAQAAEWRHRTHFEALQNSSASLRSAVDTSAKAYEMEKMRSDALLEIAAASEERLDGLTRAVQEHEAREQMQVQIEAQLRLELNQAQHQAQWSADAGHHSDRRTAPRHPAAGVLSEAAEDEIRALRAELDQHDARTAQELQEEKMAGWQRSSKLREMYLDAMEERAKLESELAELRSLRSSGDVASRTGGESGGRPGGESGGRGARADAPLRRSHNFANARAHVAASTPLAARVEDGGGLWNSDDLLSVLAAREAASASASASVGVLASQELQPRPKPRRERSEGVDTVAPLRPSGATPHRDVWSKEEEEVAAADAAADAAEENPIAAEFDAAHNRRRRSSKFLHHNPLAPAALPARRVHIGRHGSVDIGGR